MDPPDKPGDDDWVGWSGPPGRASTTSVLAAPRDRVVGARDKLGHDDAAA